jgi:O-methyltransferase involved in polyketide biosynthesis
MSSDRISPTAHYTGFVWARNGLSHPELETREGRVLFESMRLPNAVSSTLGRDSLERYLLARHRSIDLLLERAIDDGAVAQVIEVACGLSPRGWRFTQRYGSAITYVEADLPEMAARKRGALERMGSLTDHHRVAEIDALSDEGPASLAGLASALDPDIGLAIITEGLLGYLDSEAVAGVWRRFARTLATFPAGRYISDLHLGDVMTAEIRAFRVVLSAFVRGAVHLHFQSADEACAALHAAGFETAAVTPAAELAGEGSGPGGRRVHILEASTSRSP